MAGTGLLDRLELGDHLCLTFDDDDARLTAAAGYVRAGLRADQRILYFGDEPDRVRAGLGADGAAAVASGQLRLATPYDSYLIPGLFDPLATIDGWRTEAAQARADGYRGLRAMGDMSWAARPVPGADRLAWYEANVNRVFAEGAAMAVCLYDRRLFDDLALRRISEAHPGTVTPGAGAAVAAEPLLRIRRTTDPAGVRLDGEADLSNRAAVFAVLTRLAGDAGPSAGPLTVDVSGLRFADAATARLLIGVAPWVRVVGCSGALRRLLAFHGALEAFG
jgi:hypothetical protein